jgi:hypothetical protein
MRRVLALALSLFALVAAPAHADDLAAAGSDTGGERFVAAGRSDLATLSGIAAFGPFRVIDGNRAALLGVTDAATPRDFARMLIAFPALRTLELIECPGTSDDIANLRLGRMIRRAGLATHVPDGGSVRSGAVELFLAGAQRRADPRASFAVHSWQDAEGFEPADFSEDDPVNLAYLAYYREMGMSEAQARAFYAMTNAVPHEAARWLSASEFARYAPLD